MKIIYIVSRSGVEWNDLVKAFADKHAAQHFADTKNEAKNLTDVLERLSEYVVSPLEFES